MNLDSFIAAMPKVELHVHLEGAIQPQTLLALARRHGVALPADTVDGLRSWYTFSDFSHFIEVYIVISSCIRTTEDIEMIAREFLAGQAAQSIRYSEVTYTAYTHYLHKGLAFADQLAALNRARAWAEKTHGVSANWVIDISRERSAEEGLIVAGWVARARGDGVVALGLGGPEVGYPPEGFTAAFDLARAAGIASVPHAGETEGPHSIWGALRALRADRIGHGVRCLEDSALVAELRRRQTPLDVCPVSNVCLGVASSIAAHPLPRLLDAGLYVTINSDDPAMFNTSLTREYREIAAAFGLKKSDVERVVLNGVNASLLPVDKKTQMAAEFGAEFARLRAGST